MNQNIELYTDSLVIEALLGAPIKKQAQDGLGASAVSAIYNYFHDKVKEVKDSDHKFEMLSNFFLPGILSGFGFPQLAFILKMSNVLFGFNLAHIISEIFSTIGGLVKGDNKVTPSQVNSAVASAVSSNIPADPASDEEAKQKLEALKATGAKLSLREAQLIKIAFENYLPSNKDLIINRTVTAGVLSSMLGLFLGTKATTTKIITSILSFVVTAALSAGGFMLLGDLATKILGKENTSAIDGQPKTNSTTISDTTIKQDKFKVSPSYSEENFNGPMTNWIISANPNTIDSILVNWATEIYPDLKGHEQEIKNARTFALTAQAIKAYNKGSTDIIGMPPVWKSRKDVVDYFIGEVANNFKGPVASEPKTLITPTPNSPFPNSPPPKNKDNI